MDWFGSPIFRVLSHRVVEELYADYDDDDEGENNRCTHSSPERTIKKVIQTLNHERILLSIRSTPVSYGGLGTYINYSIVESPQRSVSSSDRIVEQIGER